MKQSLLKLLGVAGVVLIPGVWALDAEAGCGYVGGTRMCASWITGSEQMSATITGLGNVKDDCAEGNCPEATATVFGTRLASNPGVPFNASCRPVLVAGEWVQTADCLTTGLIFCFNPAGNSTNANGTPFAFADALSASSVVTPDDCAKNGKCFADVLVEADKVQLSNYCVNPNWTAEHFIATEMFAVSQLDFVDNKGILQSIDIVDGCSVAIADGTKYRDARGKPYTCSQLAYPYP